MSAQAGERKSNQDISSLHPRLEFTDRADGDQKRVNPSSEKLIRMDNRKTGSLNSRSWTSRKREAQISMDRWTSILFVTKTHSAVRQEYIHGTELTQSQERHFVTPTVKVKGQIILLDVRFASSARVPFPATIGDPNGIRK
jgi:hypothetical protein